ncbi:O-antigen ligase domain-containing protein [Silicimonas algicola]|uniref:O-antigen ligase-like membrane protein n=1 Tax=Silicimonas algicola TaxID=1826607 RepID=A0A316GB64_9RHOB|nr:O-antigen ligase family protein [Silicimonas algicola]AZQ65925.1 O-antigen ligase domain-containing protein [Silicimonas algicola]PWK58209.1 O-antigen ligase-like membrane protein [Silicimonas algicola]
MASPALITAISLDVALEALSVMSLGALAIVAIARPSIAVFGCALAIFTNSPMVLAEATGFTSLTEVVFLALLAVFLKDWMTERERVFRAAAPVLVTVLYFTSVCAGLLVSDHVTATIRGLMELGRFIILGCAFILVINSSTRFKAAVLGVVAGAVLLSSLTILQYVLDLKNQTFFGYAKNHITYMFGQIDEVRFGGPVAEPNFYAQILLLAYPVSLCLALVDHGRGRVLFFTCAAVIFAGVILTQSRGGMVSLAVVSLLATFLIKARAPVIVLALVSIVFLSLLVVSSEAGERITIAIQDVQALVTLKGNVTDEAIAGRVSEMLAAWHLFLENPLWGTGYDTFERLYQDTARRFDLMARGENRQAHSLFLEILAERGVIGFLAWSALLWFAFSAALEGMRKFSGERDRFGEAACAGLMIAMVGNLLTAIFLHEAFPWYFWFLIALVCSAPNAVLGSGLERGRDSIW